MVGTPGGTPDQPAIFFVDAAEFRTWLEDNHDTADELWMGRYKKHVPDRGLEWADAVREGLCFGWIDSKYEPIDADSGRQRWTPRRRGSTWSKINIAAVEELKAAGRMHPAGMAAYERRREDREGIYTYEQDGEPVLPPEFEARLRADEVAAAWFDAATPSYRKNCIRWVLTAKQEKTRVKRLDQLIHDSRHGRLIPPMRYGEQPKWVQRNRDALVIQSEEDS